MTGGLKANTYIHLAVYYCKSTGSYEASGGTTERTQLKGQVKDSRQIHQGENWSSTILGIQDPLQLLYPTASSLSEQVMGTIK